MASMEDSTLLVHTDWSEFAKRIALSSVLFITSHDQMQEQVPKDLKAFLCRDNLVNRTDPPVHSTPTNSKTQQAGRHQDFLTTWPIPPIMPPPEPSYKNIELLGIELDTKRDIAARKAK